MNNEAWNAVTSIFIECGKFLIICTLIVGALEILGTIIATNKKKRRKQNNNYETIKETNNYQYEIESEYPYKKKYLLTKNEWRFYKILKPVTDKYNIHILSKVRLADLFDIDIDKQSDNSSYQTAFNKIACKHIDFVLADPSNLKVLCLMELDDTSHNKIDRRQRDYFVDKICESASLQLIHATSETTQKELEELICENVKIENKHYM